MRSLVLCSLVLLGCGSVRSNPIDAPGSSDGSSDARCGDPTSVNSCGASCAVCMASGMRQVPTCNGTACGVSCADNAPMCSDNTCSRIVYNFDDNTLDGLTLISPVNQPFAVRNHLGSPALALDVASLAANIKFQIPFCISGTGDLSTKTLTASVFFEGTAGTQEDYFVQGALPQFVTDEFLALIGFGHNVAKSYTSALNMSNMSNATTGILLQVGTFGGQFVGTVWFDDIRIQ